MIVAHWGLDGSATAGKPGYRSQNPWQALEHYMESNRGDAGQFFAAHGATTQPADSGGSVWFITLATVPTAGGLTVSAFARALLDKLVLQNTKPEAGDYICVSYADTNAIGRWQWTP
jgi:hypothetical protein